MKFNKFSWIDVSACIREYLKAKNKYSWLNEYFANLSPFSNLYSQKLFVNYY
jgi:hypothetical protein